MRINSMFMGGKYRRTILAGVPFFLAVSMRLFSAEESVYSGKFSSIEDREIFYVDRMGYLIENELGKKNFIYKSPPSRGIFKKDKKYGREPDNPALRITFYKEASGGPHANGGWVGFYSILKNDNLFPDNAGYFNAEKYNYLTLMVKGEDGEENFKIGITDKFWEKLDDSIKTDEIGAYLPDGKITTDWQLAVIPLHELPIDRTSLASMALCFESELFPYGEGEGTIYIDDIAFRISKPKNVRHPIF